MEKPKDNLRMVKVTPQINFLAKFANDLLRDERANISNELRISLEAVLGFLTTKEAGVEKYAWDPAEALKDAVQREFGEYGGVNPSISVSTTFTTMDPKTMGRLFDGDPKLMEKGCRLYGRHYHPNSVYLGKRLAAMEDMEAAYPTASGMAAISVVLGQILSSGDKVVASSNVYGGTHVFLDKILRKRGVETTFVSPTDLKAFEEAINQENVKVVYVETEANPTLDIVDLPRLAEIADSKDVFLVVDNTFTPLSFTPVHLGADVVIYSTTKFINGRSDAIGGAVCCSKQFLEHLMDLHEGELMLNGPVMDPRSANQLNLYLNDLPLRIKAHSERALIFAERMERIYKDLKVYYPGLASHPQHELATYMMNPQYGYGGMLSLDFGDLAKAQQFVKNLQGLGGGLNAVSLGYFDTLLTIPAATTSSEIDEETQRAMGLNPGLVRISVGFTGGLESEWEKIEKAMKLVL